MIYRCEYCKFALVGYTDVATGMAELRCTKTSARGRNIYWAYDTYTPSTDSTSRGSAMKKASSGLEEATRFMKNQKQAPTWCPFRKCGG